MNEQDLHFLTKALVPAGDGVYAVTTAVDRKLNLQRLLYGDDKDNVWHRALSTIDERIPCILGIPSDSGGGILRGANWGPLALRETFYQQQGVDGIRDLGDVRVIPQLLLDEYVHPDLLASCHQALYGSDELQWPVSPLSIAEKAVDALLTAYPRLRLLTLGGDHSVSYPLVKTWLRHKKKQQRKVAIIHFDAHTDLLTSRLGVPVNFATWVSHVLPELDDKSRFIQFGIRATNFDKAHWQQRFGLVQWWAEDIKGQLDQVTAWLGHHLQRLEVDDIYVSFDVDAMDQALASATGTPEDHGLNLEEVMTILSMVKQCGLISGADVVEVAPFIKTSDADKTCSTAASVMAALLDGGIAH